MEDRRAFLIDGGWKLDGIEDQHATRVVQAIRSRRYVNQKEIAEALGIDQRRVSEALTRAIAFDMITEAEWKRSGRSAGRRRRSYERARGSCSTRRSTRTSKEAREWRERC
jgi:hypothetical protein